MTGEIWVSAESGEGNISTQCYNARIGICETLRDIWAFRGIPEGGQLKIEQKIKREALKLHSSSPQDALLSVTGASRITYEIGGCGAPEGTSVTVYEYDVQGNPLGPHQLGNTEADLGTLQRVNAYLYAFNRPE